jgi:hypothetical protein
MRKIVFLLFLLMLVPMAAAMNVSNTTNISQQDLVDAGAYSTLQNISNASSIQIDLNEYYVITEMTTWYDNQSDYDNLVRILFAPIAWGASADMLGYWLYVAIIFAIIILVYGKTRSLEITSMIMLIMSLLVIVPSYTETIVVPSVVLYILYVFAVLGVGGALMSLFTGD